MLTADQLWIMMVIITKAVGINLLILSGLESATKASSGKYMKVDHFELRAAVTDYACKSRVPFVNMQAGMCPTV